ncbi:hypothetical protein EI94DRAFT_1731455, partial [Lactarius quietus]
MISYYVDPSCWNKSFFEGIKRFRRQDVDDAPRNEAIHLSNYRYYVRYDARAFIYEKLNCLDYALRDARKTIATTPMQWHGYFRSARLFADLGQSDAALEMCSLVLKRLG